jgi:hypothetical protein
LYCLIILDFSRSNFIFGRGIDSQNCTRKTEIDQYRYFTEKFSNESNEENPFCDFKVVQQMPIFFPQASFSSKNQSHKSIIHQSHLLVVPFHRFHHGDCLKSDVFVAMK